MRVRDEAHLAVKAPPLGELRRIIVALYGSTGKQVLTENSLVNGKLSYILFENVQEKQKVIKENNLKRQLLTEIIMLNKSVSVKH